MNYKNELIRAKLLKVRFFIKVQIPYHIKKFMAHLSVRLEDRFTAFIRNHPELYPEGQPMETVGRATTGGGLSIKHIRKDGKVIDYGMVSRAKVTDEYVAFMTDCQQSTDSTFADFKYHISGTGGTAESKTQTALVTPIGTARTVGTQVEGASAWIYRSVATIAYTGTSAVTEHALFNEAYVDAQDNGIMMDRNLFLAVNVVNGESIQYTYELTNTAEA